MCCIGYIRKVGRWQEFANPKGQSETYIKEEQTTQWPKRKRTKGQTTIDKTYIYI